MLGDSRRNLYGQQRLWGAVGWGLFAVVVGYAIQRLGIVYMFAVHAVGMVFAVATAAKLPIAAMPLKKSWCATVAKLLSSFEFCVFLFETMILGWLSGVVGSFLFLYLKLLNGTELLLGLTLFFTCVAEVRRRSILTSASLALPADACKSNSSFVTTQVPIMFYSAHITEALGEFGVLAFAFFCFAIRNGLYSVLENPWFVLPVELLHGITYVTRLAHHHHP